MCDPLAENRNVERIAMMRTATDDAKDKRPARPGGPSGRGLDAVLLSAIENQEVVSFVYNGEQRVVEPQTYGVSIAGHRVLRARQIAGGSRSGQSRIAKLFDVEKISALRKTGARFEKALPEHNPNDSAMREVFASLPRPGSRSGLRATGGAKT
jgi:hypothetical protein